MAWSKPPSGHVEQDKVMPSCFWPTHRSHQAEKIQSAKVGGKSICWQLMMKSSQSVGEGLQ